MRKRLAKRRSHCEVCGKRLSVKTPYGDIRWQPSRVDDHGIYCPTCYDPAKKGPVRKKKRS